MRVLLVHNRYRSDGPGGEDVVFEQEQNLLSKLGVEVFSYTRSNDEMDPSSSLDKLRVLRGLHRSGRTVRELRGLLRKNKPDIAHFHNTFPLISASAYEVCRAFGIPVVQTIHNFGLVCASRTFFRETRVCQECSPGRYGAAIRHACYGNSHVASAAIASMLWRNFYSDVHRRCIDCFLALSPFVADWLAGVGIERSRIRIKPNFITPVDRSLNASSEAVIFAGRLSIEKGIYTLLEAWRSLPDIPLQIYGDGPERGGLLRFVEQHRLNVRFMGLHPHSEVLSAISKARMLVMASGCFEGGVPLVVLESWAVGTPVIASRIGSTTSISEGVEALQFVPGNADELARKVRRLWGDRALAAELARNGLKRFEAEHTEEIGGRQLVTLYKELLTQRTAQTAQAS